MWVFYLISLPLTAGLVAATLRYFAGPAVPLYVLATVGYAWLCSLSFVILVPADIYTVRSRHSLLPSPAPRCSLPTSVAVQFSWVIVPTIRGYEDAGDFTVKERLKTSLFLSLSKVVQATSKQMSKRDPVRPYMDIIDNMLAQMLRDDPLVKISGGKLEENDMDYDTDEKTMAELRRRLRRAHEEYCRCKSNYTTAVMEALELEDTVTNYEQHDADGWKYVSDIRESRSGTLGSILDHIVAGNFFGYLFEIFGSWKRFKFWTEEEEDMDGFDPSGVFILQKERSWIEQARKLGEQVTPLARNFSSISKDVESGNVLQATEKVGLKVTVYPAKSEGGAQSKYGVNVDHKYSSIREHPSPSSHQPVKEVQKENYSTSVLLEAGNSEKPSPDSVAPDSSAGITSRWTSMKAGFQSFKSNASFKRLLPLNLSRTDSSTSSGSLDEIFEGLKRHSSKSNPQADYLDEDDNTIDTN
ncbi:hypothetical protein ACQ4PT_013551 [Festuca glaucescens]